MIDHEKNARFLFDLLDEIDTIGDMAKENLRLYRDMVEKVQRRRFDVASTDGYTVKFIEQERPA
jgi:hypothetical protein